MMTSLKEGGELKGSFPLYSSSQQRQSGEGTKSDRIYFAFKKGTKQNYWTSGEREREVKRLDSVQGSNGCEC